MSTDPGQPFGEPLADGPLSAAISNAAVRIHRDYLGRGPDKARTTIADGIVVVLMQDTLTKAERSLVAAGQRDAVLRTRQTFQHTMRRDLVGAIEQLSGRTVMAFMSANHIDPDLACEVLVLAPEPSAGGRSDAPGPARHD